MRKILIPAIIIFLFSCNSASDKTSQTDSLANEQAESARPNQYDHLLAQYKQLNVDTFLVFSSPDDVEADTFRYKGKRLDTADIKLLPREFAEQYSADATEFFACYKFHIDSTHIGLITRTPSEYVPSSIKLLVYDLPKNSITHYIELSETLGDAGDNYDKSSWLYKNSAAQWHSLSMIQDSHDNSVDNEGDTTIDVTHSYYKLRISGKSVDTLSTDSSTLVKEFTRFH